MRLWMCVMWQEWNRNKCSQDGEDVWIVWSCARLAHRALFFTEGCGTLNVAPVWESLRDMKNWSDASGLITRGLSAGPMMGMCFRFSNGAATTIWRGTGSTADERPCIGGARAGCSVSFVVVGGGCGTTWCVGPLRPRRMNWAYAFNHCHKLKGVA